MALAAAIAVGVRAWQYDRTHVSTDDAQVDGHVVPVLPKIGGYIAHVHVADNQLVAAGDTLFTIDDRDYAVRVQQAAADLDAAIAAGRGGGASALIETARAQRAALDGNVAAARAVYEHAARDLVRFRMLAANDIASASQLDAAVAAEATAAAELRSAKDHAASGSASILGADYAAEVADRRTAALAAALATARLQLSYTVVTAPVAGRVARRTVEVGQLVSAGQQLLAVVQRDTMWVTANLKETQLGDVRIGQSVLIRVDAYPDLRWHGHVESFQQATGSRFALLPPDNATGNFTKVVQRIPVKISIDDASSEARLPELAPGEMVQVTIDTRTARRGTDRSVGMLSDRPVP